MKKRIAIVLGCFVILLFIGLFTNFEGLTGWATKGNIIISINPQGELNNKATHIDVISSEKAHCMYNLGIQDKVSFKYYQVMGVTDDYRHKQLLKDLYDNEYELSVKCTGDDGFVYRKDVDLTVKLPDVCSPYCEYIDDCDEYSSDGCDGICKRETDGSNCGEGRVCSGGLCIDREEPVGESIDEIEELPVVVEKSESFMKRILRFLRNVFS